MAKCARLVTWKSRIEFLLFFDIIIIVFYNIFFSTSFSPQGFQ